MCINIQCKRACVIYFEAINTMFTYFEKSPSFNSGNLLLINKCCVNSINNINAIMH